MAGSTGVVWPIQRIVILADCIIDGHMHNNSGSGAPLPLVYAQIVDAIGISFEGTYRSFIEFLISLQFKEGVHTQRMSSFEIGKRIIGLNKATYAPWTESTAFARNTRPPVLISSNEPQNQKPLFTPMFTMQMDLERPHIAGYEGKTIYQISKGKTVYFKRHSSTASYEEGEEIDVSHEMGKHGNWKFQKWVKQCRETLQVTQENPFQIFPMFFFDPRRWRSPTGGDFDAVNWDHGPWDFPFQQIATSNNPGFHIGFKMYTPLGHMPLDPQLPFLNNFYARCQADNIPILAHCSPGGMTTHEIKFFRKYCKAYPLYYSKMTDEFEAFERKLIAHSGLPHTPEEYSIEFEGRHLDIEFFLRYYVHPRAWIPVLKKYPGIKLCLAHFGGDEWKKYEKPWLESDWIRSMIHILDFRKQPCKNIYTDLSCFNLNDPDERKHLGDFLKLLHNPEYSHLKERIIFASDWYLTLLTGNDGGYYKNYCETFKKFLDDLDSPECDSELWVRFSFLNPFEFYGLGNSTMLQNMNQAFGQKFSSKRNNKCGSSTENYNRILALKDQADRLKSQLSTL